MSKNDSDLNNNLSEPSRRQFLTSATALATGLAASMASPSTAMAATPTNKVLQVWSCGGLAEAMMPAHEQFKATTGHDIAYTGAFAAVLGKSLLTGRGKTEVFLGRVLALAQNLRKAEKMLSFKPLCFTEYVIVVPKNNPGKIKSIEDLAKPNTKVAMSPLASPPGGQAVMGILKAADIQPAVMKNVMDKRASCVQRTIEDVTTGKAHAMIVERRLTKVPLYAPHIAVIDIPEKFFPAGPLTFTIGIMRDVKDMELAESYVNFMTSPEGQAHFEKAGFIPAISEKGQELIEKLGVKDVTV